MELNKNYILKNGETVVFDSISIYNDINMRPLDIYTSKNYHGAWNKKGRYLTNLYFEGTNTEEMDVQK